MIRRHQLILFWVVIKIFHINCQHNIIFVRHGHSTDTKITRYGERQIQFAATRINEMNLNFTEIFTSTMSRAIESSQTLRKALCQHCKIIEDSVLNEVNPNTVLGGMQIQAAYTKYFQRAKPRERQNTLIVGHSNMFRALVTK